MKVSIVIPCYNHWQYLPEALESALSQTHSDIEIIVVDDGSEERPPQSLLEMLAQKGICLIKIPHSGPSSARNLGIENATGQLILPLDADDKIGPTYIEKAQRIFLDQENVGIVYCDAQYFGSRNDLWDLPPYNFPDILFDNFIFSAALFKKEDWQKAGGYNVNMTQGWEDHDFWLSLIELKKTVVRIPEVLFYYRQNPDSRTNRFNSQQKIEMFEQMTKNHRKLYAENIDSVLHRFAEFKQLLEEDTPEMEVKRELQNLRDRIRQMESSGFWKLRNKWQKVKRALKVPAQHAPRES